MKPETLDSIIMRVALTDEQLVELTQEALALELTNPHTYACTDDTDAYSRQIAQAVEYYSEALINAHMFKLAENQRHYDQLRAAKLQHEISTQEAAITVLRLSLLGLPLNSYAIINDIQDVRNKIAVLQRELDLFVEDCKQRDWKIY